MSSSAPSSVPATLPGSVAPRRRGRRTALGAAALLALVAVVACGLVATLAAATRLSGLGGLVPRHAVLELDLTTPPAEHSSDDPFSVLLAGADALAVRDIVDALERAGTDDRVKGLIVILGGEAGGMAVAQEVRDAITAFRSHDKDVIAFSETFGEGAPGNGGYYVAAAADDIFLQPSGDVGLVGLVWQAQFLKGTLEKLEIQPQMDQRWEYKNAMNQYTETEFTAAHAEASQAVLESQQSQLVAGIAEGRGLEKSEVEDLIDRGPFLAREALEAGLVDRLAYRDEAYDEARTRADDGQVMKLATYLKSAGRPHQRGTKIALIYGVGSVVRGESGYDPLMATQSMGSDTVAAAFRAAADDDSVKAIVFRIDSPGGSYVASDTIWHEVERARKAGKPVIASMGNVAGSGGYFVAMSADKIVAQPGTVTGSIGVFGGKLLLRDFLSEKLGVTVDDLTVSKNARMYLSTSPYTAEEWQREQDWLDSIYEDFTQKVADGRDMELADVQAVARGRIWSGEDALALGLVDELGGLPAALRLARAELDLDEDADLRVVVLPKERPWWQQLMEGASGSGSVAKRASAALDDVRPLLRSADAAGLLGEDPQLLTMPEEVPLP